ncbi:MAG: hypothetical protein M1835_005491 [Candelina submexicana]|nr:MAG: hypothetical protein M1835_005491 [Candelina submexicana]
MASIFSYDPEPPRISSPWLMPGIASSPGTSVVNSTRRFTPSDAKERNSPQSSILANCGITKLEAEPQEGPTEYKLHLLLRPRRSFSASSTGHHVSGSYHSRLHSATQQPQNGAVQGTSPAHTSTPSNQSRQNRLQQLTTQLLWRLQQSSPYHASSTGELVLPNLPEAAPVLGTPARPGRPLPGLEESRGALYEIGVSDDGTLVGLTSEEMDESLSNLEAMAGSLGCRVKVLRMIVVGNCEWIEGSPCSENSAQTTHTAKLWVAEALVKPDVEPPPQVDNEATLMSTPLSSPQHSLGAVEGLRSSTEQLRVSLTGATTSGKSSLLGTLSTATLDHGRGKSRLSLLKHRHEIQSGLTSSVAQELIGYRQKDIKDEDNSKATEVINYASGNVSSWNDLHSSSKDGRLVFLSDSAGHPRFRRTTVRGLVGWSPHWTILCVAADAGEELAGGNGGTPLAQDPLGSLTAAASDLSQAHLDLCLKLKLPLVIAITKLDLASKVGLKHNLAKVLTTLKSNGRKPVMLSTAPTSTEVGPDLQYLSKNDESEVERALREVRYGNYDVLVPILLTSAVNGTGISKMHALLHKLPIPTAGDSPPISSDVVGQAIFTPRVLFHVEDIYTAPAANGQVNLDRNGANDDSGFVLSGHLRYGELSIGDELVLGPVPTVLAPLRCDDMFNDTASSMRSKDLDPDSRSLSRTRFISSTPPTMTPKHTYQASTSTSEWRRVRINTVRNLRLPVRTLSTGQVGTVGFSILQPAQLSHESSLSSRSVVHQIPDSPTCPSTTMPKIRKGMVLMHSADRSAASNGFVAQFNHSDFASMSLGNLVVVYIASVRATARIVSFDLKGAGSTRPRPDANDDSEEMFSFDDGDGHSEDPSDAANLPRAKQLPPQPTMSEVTFRFVTCREWIELGSQVLVMPGGGPGLYVGSERGEKGVGGLEGFVGNIVRVF